jgi:hypothetical protein
MNPHSLPDAFPESAATHSEAIDPADGGMKWARRLTWLLAVYPLGWLGLFYSFVLRARVTLRFWPTPYRPDPQELGFTLHHLAINLGMVVLPVAVLSVLALVLLVPSSINGRRNWSALILAVVSLGLAITLARLDPGHYFEWFAD